MRWDWEMVTKWDWDTVIGAVAGSGSAAQLRKHQWEEEVKRAGERLEKRARFDATLKRVQSEASFMRISGITGKPIIGETPSSAPSRSGTPVSSCAPNSGSYTAYPGGPILRTPQGSGQPRSTDSALRHPIYDDVPICTAAAEAAKNRLLSPGGKVDGAGASMAPTPKDSRAASPSPFRASPGSSDRSNSNPHSYMMGGHPTLGDRIYVSTANPECLKAKLNEELNKPGAHSSSGSEKELEQWRKRRDDFFAIRGYVKGAKQTPLPEFVPSHIRLAEYFRTVPSTTVDANGCVIQKGFVIPPRPTRPTPRASARVMNQPTVVAESTSKTPLPVMDEPTIVAETNSRAPAPVTNSPIIVAESSSRVPTPSRAPTPVIEKPTIVAEPTSRAPASIIDKPTIVAESISRTPTPVFDRPMIVTESISRPLTPVVDRPIVVAEFSPARRPQVSKPKRRITWDERTITRFEDADISGALRTESEASKSIFAEAGDFADSREGKATAVEEPVRRRCSSRARKQSKRSASEGAISKTNTQDAVGSTRLLEITGPPPRRDAKVKIVSAHEAESAIATDDEDGVRPDTVEEIVEPRVVCRPSNCMTRPAKGILKRSSIRILSTELPEDAAQLEHMAVTNGFTNANTPAIQRNNTASLLGRRRRRSCRLREGSMVPELSAVSDAQERSDYDENDELVMRTRAGSRI